MIRNPGTDTGRSGLYLLAAVALVVALGGCVGGIGGPVGGGDGDAGGASGGAAPSDGSSGSSGDGGGASADWCVAGERASFADPETGDQVTMEVVGVVDRDGRQVCKATWETNQGDVRRIEMYFSEDGSYREMVTYDADGNVVNEFSMSGPGSGGASGPDSGGNTGGDASGASDDWCAEGQTMAFANPQTGEQASMEVVGIVDRDGRQVCKATWETNQGDVARIEMYFTEDGSYREMVTYDADGNVVNEVRLSG